ncbi:MAG: SagB/ThcOx family dehydrogenase [Planctomycetota bacterium]
MRSFHVISCTALLVVASGLLLALRPACSQPPAQSSAEGPSITLPAARLTSTVSLEQAIQKRRSVRRYRDQALTLEQVGQLLWAANGVTGPDARYRAAPSAGALHPADFYLVAGVGSVGGLDAGVWHHEPEPHSIRQVRSGDVRRELAGLCMGQRHVAIAEVVVAVTVEYARTNQKYGELGQRYALVDAAMAAENLLLQVEALGLAACVIGGFRAKELGPLLGIPREHEPVILVTVGYPEA